jgi:large subunit ribosomal protein L17
MRTVLAVLIGLVLAATGLLLFVWLLWWLWNREREDFREIEIEIDIKSPQPSREPGALEAEAPIESTDRSAEEEPPPTVETEAPPIAEFDDLRRVEGIGPKIASVLEDAGITTFSGLAQTGVGRINEILEEADPRLRSLADPTTWPEQAALAASGDWEALSALQSELRGGRRSQRDS